MNKTINAERGGSTPRSAVRRAPGQNKAGASAISMIGPCGVGKSTVVGRLVERFGRMGMPDLYNPGCIGIIKLDATPILTGVSNGRII